MEVLRTVCTVLQFIVTIGLIVFVLLQEGNSQGLSGSIGGGAETFFGKGKSKTMDGILKTLTKYMAVLFIVLSLALTYLYRTGI